MPWWSARQCSAPIPGRLSRVNDNKSTGQIQSELIEYYDAESANRDRLSTEGRRLVGRQRAISSVLPTAPARLLDIGPGPGRDVAALTAAGFEVTAIDLSYENATRCRGHGAMALVGSVSAMPVCSSSFDAIWSMSVLMHVTDEAIAATIGELRRMLRPDGVAVLGVWGRPTGDSAKTQVDLDRNFFPRSNPEWKRLLSDHLGEIEHYETWPHPEAGDRFYQWAEVRAQ